MSISLLHRSRPFLISDDTGGDNVDDKLGQLFYGDRREEPAFCADISCRNQDEQNHNLMKYSCKGLQHNWILFSDRRKVKPAEALKSH